MGGRGESWGQGRGLGLSGGVAVGDRGESCTVFAATCGPPLLHMHIEYVLTPASSTIGLSVASLPPLQIGPACCWRLLQGSLAAAPPLPPLRR